MEDVKFLKRAESFEELKQLILSKDPKFLKAIIVICLEVDGTVEALHIGDVLSRAALAQMVTSTVQKEFMNADNI